MTDIEKSLGVFGGVRGRFRSLDPTAAVDDNTGYAMYVSLGPATPLGHLRQTITASAITLASIAGWPTGVKKIDFFNLSETEYIFFTDLNGQAPSSSLGFPIPPLSWLRYDNDVVPADFKLATLGGSASLAIATYA